MASGLDPPDALLLAGDLALARRRLNTESDLHAMFLLTDVRERIDKVDWGTVYRVLFGLKVRAALRPWGLVAVLSACAACGVILLSSAYQRRLLAAPTELCPQPAEMPWTVDVPFCMALCVAP